MPWGGERVVIYINRQEALAIKKALFAVGVEIESQNADGAYKHIETVTRLSTLLKKYTDAKRRKGEAKSEKAYKF